MRILYEWGSTPAERAQPFPCDRFLATPDAALYRAVDVGAPARVVYRWLCQLRVAPYSYDLLDNGGRQSPRALTPGLDRLEVGQPVMRIFRLVDFEPERSLTVVHRGRIFGRLAGTYSATPVSERRSRLVVKLLVSYAPAPLGPPLRAVLPAGDLVMMRRQLLNLARLAESTATG